MSDHDLIDQMLRNARDNIAYWLDARGWIEEAGAARLHLARINAEIARRIPQWHVSSAPVAMCQVETWQDV